MSEGFSREEVSTAVNNAIEMLVAECELDTAEQNLMNLAVNAILTALDQCGEVTLSDVADACYDEDVTGDTLVNWHRTD